MDWDKVERDLKRTQRRLDSRETPYEESLNLMAFRGTLQRLLESRSDTAQS